MVAALGKHFGALFEDYAAFLRMNQDKQVFLLFARLQVQFQRQAG
jgi:hypothetical protein